jgi:hypothetical protein
MRCRLLSLRLCLVDSQRASTQVASTQGQTCFVGLAASVVSTNAKPLGQADPLAKKVDHRGNSNTADYKKNDNDFRHTVIRKDLHPLDLQVAVQLVWHREHLGMIFSSLVLIAPDIQPRAHSVSFWSVRRCWMPSSKQLCWICRECAETVA